MALNRAAVAEQAIDLVIDDVAVAGLVNLVRQLRAI
jgi:hypothetical protein